MATFDADVRACETALRAARDATIAATAEAARRIQSGRAEIVSLKTSLASLTPAWLAGASDADVDVAVAQALRTAHRLRDVAIDVKAAASSDARLASAVPVAERPELDRLASLGEDAFTQLGTAMQSAVDDEKKCRADKKCMAARAAKKAEAEFFAATVSPMCDADQMRENGLATMARERANPSGYVDKVVLHDAGADVQAGQETLRQFAVAYAKLKVDDLQRPL